MRNRKTIVIIGGGMSGLSAGIYAEQQGFHAIILEKNPSVGGFCTGWYREGRYLDGCIHWMTGTKEDTVLCDMWKNLGAFSTQEDIIYLDSWGTFEYQGEKITFWCDLDKAEKEWKTISPVDSKRIHRFFKKVKDFISVELPLDVPMSMLSFKQKLAVGLNVLSVWPSYLWSMKCSCEKYASKFKSPLIRWALTHVQTGPNNLFSMLYSYATVAEGDGGIPKGGSKPMAERIKHRFIELGGTLKLNSSVKEINIEKGKCVGVTLSNNEIIKSDYVVTALDPNYVINKLLLNQYPVSSITRRFNNPRKHPCPSCCLLNFEVTDIPDLPIPFSFEVEPFKVGNENIFHLTLRSYAYDKENFVIDNKTIMSVLLDQYSYDYEYWRALHNDKEEYLKIKKDIEFAVISRIIAKFPKLQDKIKLLDLATPYTLHRYTNATRGSYMGYCFTNKNSMFVHNGTVKGVKNLYLSSQWLQSPGGLPLAIAEGKFAIQRICKKENLSILFDHPKKATVKN